MSFRGKSRGLKALNGFRTVAVAGVVTLLAAGVAAPQGLARDQGERPFRHVQHERLSCRTCHGAGEEHRTVLVRTRRDCAACHHSREDYSCADCHRRTELPGPGRVAATMELSVWSGSRVRALPFAHETHAAIICQSCHRTPVTLAMGRECGACHAEHHRPEAECAQCHRPAAAGVHAASSHLTCAAAGCHATATARAPVLSRTLCLMCHAEQRTHEPGGDCAACHKIRHFPPGQTAARAPAAPGRRPAP